MTYPHCDPRVLHAPLECEYCDKHSEWQELRVYWKINFTGHHEPDRTTCPSEIERPLSNINKWDGNVPQKDGRVNADAPMFEGKTVLHNKFTRHVEVLEADPLLECKSCNGTGSADSGASTPWGSPVYVRCECTYFDPKKSLLQKIREYLDIL